MAPVHMKQIPRLPHDRIEADVSDDPHKEAGVTPLGASARTHGGIKARMEAKNEARSGSL